MRPKGKLLALVAVFAAIGIITASGAFTTVSAERTATIDVANDTNAQLQLEPHTANDFASYNGNGALQFTFNDVNLNAKTTFEYVFNITNNQQAGDTIYVWLEKVDGSGADQSQYVSFYKNGSSTALGTNITGSTNAATLNSGETIQISVEINLQGVTSISENDVLLDSILIHAQTEDPNSS